MHSLNVGLVGVMLISHVWNVLISHTLWSFSTQNNGKQTVRTKLLDCGPISLPIPGVVVVQLHSFSFCDFEIPQNIEISKISSLFTSRNTRI